jgi:hypothetical protein
MTFPQSTVLPWVSHKDYLTVYINNWAGPALAGMQFVEKYDYLTECHGRTVLLEVVEANKRLDVVRQLIAQNNYLVFCTQEPEQFWHFLDIQKSVPELINYGLICQGQSDIQPSVSLDYHINFIYTEPNHLRALHTTPHVFSKKNKPYKFLYLNGRDRPARRMLFEKIRTTGFLDQSLYSWQNKVVVDEVAANDVFHPTHPLPDYYNQSWAADNDTLTDASDLRNKHLRNDFYRLQWTTSQLIPNQYIDTYFGVVQETTHTGYPIITEKIYRHILAGHPFIVAGPPGYYQALKKWGFKTFEPFIDESFDSVEDTDTRFALIASEVQRLCNSDLDLFLSEVKHICLFNQQHYIDNQFKFWLEMHRRLVEFVAEINQITADLKI